MMELPIPPPVSVDPNAVPPLASDNSETDAYYPQQPSARDVTLVKYPRLLSFDVLRSEGNPRVVSAAEWISITTQLMDMLVIPSCLCRDFSVHLLQGEARRMWQTAHGREYCNTWPRLAHFLQILFNSRDEKLRFHMNSTEFHQQMHETTVAYGLRFTTVLMKDCPYLMDDWEMRVIYWRGLLKECRPIDHFLSFSNFRAIKEATELYDKRIRYETPPLTPDTPAVSVVTEDGSDMEADPISVKWRTLSCSNGLKGCP